MLLCVLCGQWSWDSAGRLRNDKTDDDKLKLYINSDSEIIQMVYATWAQLKSIKIVKKRVETENHDFKKTLRPNPMPYTR